MRGVYRGGQSQSSRQPKCGPATRRRLLAGQQARHPPLAPSRPVLRCQLPRLLQGHSTDEVPTFALWRRCRVDISRAVGVNSGGTRYCSWETQSRRLQRSVKHKRRPAPSTKTCAWTSPAPDTWLHELHLHELHLHGTAPRGRGVDPARKKRGQGLRWCRVLIGWARSSPSCDAFGSVFSRHYALGVWTRLVHRVPVARARCDAVSILERIHCLPLPLASPRLSRLPHSRAVPALLPISITVASPSPSDRSRQLAACARLTPRAVLRQAPDCGDENEECKCRCDHGPFDEHLQEAVLLRQEQQALPPARPRSQQSRAALSRACSCAAHAPLHVRRVRSARRPHAANRRSCTRTRTRTRSPSGHQPIRPAQNATKALLTAQHRQHCRRPAVAEKPEHLPALRGLLQP